MVFAAAFTASCNNQAGLEKQTEVIGQDGTSHGQGVNECRQDKSKTVAKTPIANTVKDCGQGIKDCHQDIKYCGQDVNDVLERIRQDVGYYEYYEKYRRGLHNDPDKIGSGGVSLDLVCNTKGYDFDVQKVTPTLQVYASEDASGDIGLKIPLLPAGSSIGPDINGKNIQTATQTLTFDRFYNPKTAFPPITPAVHYPLTKELKTATERSSQNKRPTVTPIADTLIRLRKALVQSAAQEPCFDTVDGGGHSNDTLTINFVVEKDDDPNIGFNIWVISAKAGIEKDTKNTSTLTVTFAPLPLPKSPSHKAVVAKQLARAS